MATYTKLFHSILDSSVWQLSKEARLVWITMLGMTDREGRVFASIPGLADRAKVSLRECEEALRIFSAPDKWSRSQIEKGKRIRPIEGGWELINFKKYRDSMSREERREYKAAKQAEYRKRKGAARTEGAKAGAVQAVREASKQWNES